MSGEKITSLRGIGPRRAELLGKLGLFYLADLVRYLPRAHVDYSAPVCVSQLMQGGDALLRLDIISEPTLARIRRGLTLVRARGTDDTGEVELVWFNQPYRKQALHKGDSVFCAGRADLRRGTKLISPALFDAPPGILPIYPLTAGISQTQLRENIRAALSAYVPQELICAELRRRFDVCDISTALHDIHFPPDAAALSKAQRRLALEDMAAYRLMLDMLRYGRARQGVSFNMQDIKRQLCSLLPYELTASQSRAMDDIAADMQSLAPMNRLLQGDVGSGKTAVALFAMLGAVQNGCQAALMAPTELLAAQHFELVRAVFGADALLLSGGMRPDEREAAYAAIRDGSAKAVVGTHALLEEGVEFCRLGLIVTDEQHRFGVAQRAKLMRKGASADVLIMSATPIPRTLALMYYGELDISTLNELPPGREPVKTVMVPKNRRDAMYGYIDRRVKEGAQAYVVCPLVEQSEELAGLPGAVELAAELNKCMTAQVGLLHGRMSPAEKDAAMEAFRTGKTQVLVSTTVIEVGVDVHAAAVIAIEGAERFGLAQLHQLRGRVGRGAADPYCFLLTDSDAESVSRRLETLVNSNDGFYIAEQDMLQRGPGEFLGSRQHGAFGFSALLLADNMALLKEAEELAGLCAGEYAYAPETRALLAHVLRRMEQLSDWTAL